MGTTVSISNESLSLTVCSLGAEMQTLVTSDGRSWLWNGDPASWSGRAPILFPIVGKARNDSVIINGTVFPMPLHGFAHCSEFAVVRAGRGICMHELRASAKTRQYFPFDFLLTVEHRLDGFSLIVTAQISNLDDVEMPFSFGFHPAFCWPLPGAEQEDHVIELDNAAEPEMVRHDKGLLLSARHPSPFREGKLKLGHEQFDDGPMIFPEGSGATLKYGVKDGPGLGLKFDNLPNLALWTKLRAPFICIEPWHGLAAELGGPDDIVARPSSMTLRSGHSAKFSYQVELPQSEF